MSRACSSAADHLDAAYTLSPVGFTVSLWFKALTLLTGQQLVNIGTSGSGTNRYTVGMSATNAPNTNHNDGTNAIATAGATSLGDGAHHNIVSTLTSLSSRASFVDGINKGTNANTRTALIPNAIRISGDLSGGVPILGGGLVSHVAIWSGVVSDADIALLATVSPNMVRPDILIDYWPLQSGSASEPSYGSRGTILSVTGTTFSTDDPALNQGIIQPMFQQRKVIYSL